MADSKASTIIRRDPNLTEFKVRIVIQIWAYYAGFFNWTVIHRRGGVVLGIITVTLVILLDRFVPEFGEFLFSTLKR